MLIKCCVHMQGVITKDSKTNEKLEKPINYNNYVFYAEGPKDPDDRKEYIFGDDKVPREYKVNVDRWKAYYGDKSPKELEGKDVRFFFDENKKFVGYQIVK